MNKPDDIDQHAWDKAATYADDPGSYAWTCGDGAQIAIARAIMDAKAEEREACAAICDPLANHKLKAGDDFRSFVKAEMVDFGAKTASIIAATIRARATKS